MICFTDLTGEETYCIIASTLYYKQFINYSENQSTPTFPRPVRSSATDSNRHENKNQILFPTSIV